MNKQDPQTTSEYLTQLAAELKKTGVKDVDDIIADYQDYFTQSKAKGYSDAESIRRLPAATELAASYADDSQGAGQVPAPKDHPSSAQRYMMFGATLVGDILLLPFLFIMALLLACFAFVGVCLAAAGLLLFVPDTMLGQMDVARPPLLQLLPTVLLFIASGTAVIAACIAIYERLYSTIRASIVVRRWILTGKHNDHLKLIPRIHKRFRTLLYRVILIASSAAVLLLLILAGLSWLAQGTVNFPSLWT